MMIIRCRCPMLACRSLLRAHLASCSALLEHQYGLGLLRFCPRPRQRGVAINRK